MKRLLGFSLLGGLLLAGAWLAIGARDAATDSRSGASSASDEATAPEVPPGPESAAEHPVRAEIRPAQRPLPTLPPPPVEPGTEDTSIDLSVVVVDTRGEVVPDGRVEVWSEEEQGPTPLRTRLATHPTDPSGRCLLSVASTKHCLVASKDSVGTSGESLVALLRPDEGDVVLTLRPPGRVRGVVLHADGSAAVGARVHFFRVVTDPTSLGRVPPDATADAEGRFESTLDATAVYRVAAFDGERRTDLERVSVAQGREVEVSLRFPGAFLVTGTLLEVDGRPAAHGTIYAWGPEGSGPETTTGPSSRGSTDADGSFRVDLPRPGRYALFGGAFRRGWSDPAVVEVAETDPRASVTLRLAPLVAITGRVRRDDGTPVSGALVTASLDPRRTDRGDAGGLPARVDRFVGGDWFAQSGPDGSFRIGETSAEALYVLRCAPDRARRSSRVSVRGVRGNASDVEIVVSEARLRGCVVSGVVTDEATGLPVPRFVVDVLTPHPESEGWSHDERRFDDAQGRFRLEGLETGGVHALVVSADGLSRAVIPPWTAEAGDRALAVPLAARAEAEVRVADLAGRPVPHAEVTVQQISKPPVAGPRARRHADARGNAGFAALDAGRHRARARSGDLEGESVEFDVAGGGRAVVELRVPR